jgi:F420-dependent oxidoreductase-like protein
VGEIAGAESNGFQAAWLPQIFGAGALAVLAAAAGETKRIELGTAVVPIFLKHPLSLAQEALTVQSLSSGRFTLGIGLSHKPVVENMFGESFDPAFSRMREYVGILAPLLSGESVSQRGDFYSATASVNVAGATEVTLLLAALGPRMLALAGERAAGTITWMTARRAVAEHIAPKVVSAAERAGRPAPRIVAGLPVTVTSDPDGARDRADRVFAMYGALPSYRAVLDIAGADSPAEVLVAGDEETVAAELAAYIDDGATEILASVLPFGAGETERTQSKERTLSLLKELNGGD